MDNVTVLCISRAISITSYLSYLTKLNKLDKVLKIDSKNQIFSILLNLMKKNYDETINEV